MAGRVLLGFNAWSRDTAWEGMTLEALEFIRRFAMHILPKGFVRIRHYGIVSSTSKATCAAVIKEQLPQVQNNKKPKKEIYNPLQCPCCKKQTMQTLLRFNRRGPPGDWQQMAKNILECII